MDGTRVIYRDVTATVGRTPMVALGRVAKGLPARLLGKLEMRNPCGSVKDRLGVALIEDAERQGRLHPGMTVVEPTGGNTGTGLALAAAIRGYRLVLTMPETMSAERVSLLRQLGAEVILTPGILMLEAVTRAKELVKKLPGSVMLDQFSNPANPDVHRRTTAVEIWDDTEGKVDVFNHRIPGIGVGFVPAVLNRSIIDEVIPVRDDDAFACTQRLAREEGIVAGPSSGAALHAALSVAARHDAGGKVIVVLLADTGERYITTSLFPRQ